MTLGPRLAIVTTALMATVLGLATAALLVLRRRDLESDLRTQATQVGQALASGLEPLGGTTAPAELALRVERAAREHAAFQLEILRAGSETTTDAGWVQLLEGATGRDEPLGRFFAPTGRAPFFAMAVPLHDAIPGEPARHIVAVIGLKRSTDDIRVMVANTAKKAALVFAASIAVLGLIVFLSIRSRVVRPLRRLLEAIDAVAQGDLTRALLPARNDEIGELADRFNEMTNGLREARTRALRETEARSALETRLRHSEKLAAMGQMAAEIAHEVGTPLHVIGGRAHSLTKRAHDPDDVAKHARIITTQVDRITKIIRQVLDFSRKGHPTQTQVHMGRLAEEAMAFLAAGISRQGITTRLDVPGSLPAVPGDPDELLQVCLNLLTNAVQAMPHGGRLQVRAQAIERRKEGLELSAPSTFVVLEVSDSGAGIPSADRERIFEPFFTTKDVGEGTGLGLAVSHGIVKDHDGWIEVDEGPAGGATLRVYLPAEPPA